jgi:hypothetical protein
MFPFRTELNRAFFEHWKSLRAGAALPLLRDFLSKPQPRLQPHVVIKDILPERGVLIRLHGTRLVELAGEDLTGQDLLDYSDTPEMADDLWFFQRGIVDHPVGLSVLKQTVTASGRNVRFEEFSLPMSPFRGGPPCVVGCVVLMEEVGSNDTVSHMLTYSDAVWIDLGWGTPAFRPLRPRPADLQHGHDLVL